MRKTDTTDEVGKKVEREPFDLKLPTEINPAPWQVIDLPRNKQALIYKVTNVVGRNGESRDPYDTYDVYVVSKKTMKTGNDQFRYNTSSFDNIPKLKHWLYDMAAALSVKRSTIKKVNVVDLHEPDDDDD